MQESRDQYGILRITLMPEDDAQAAIDKVIAEGRGAVFQCDEQGLVGPYFLKTGADQWSNTIPGTTPVRVRVPLTQMDQES